MIYETFKKGTGSKLAVLIDPDKHDTASLLRLINHADNCKADYLFIGGSLLLEANFEATVQTIKDHSQTPLIIFPGNNYQLSALADAILFLSLISGRNPEYLIGQQVVAAPTVKKLGLEAIPTGYMLVDGGRVSATSYMTQTVPIPNDKTDIAVATAQAGELLGMKLIYLEAGSGAKDTVSAAMIKEVKRHISIPLIVGGGIRSAEQAEEICKAGADVIVVGNALEETPGLLMEISLAVHGVNKAKA